MRRRSSWHTAVLPDYALSAYGTSLYRVYKYHSAHPPWLHIRLDFELERELFKEAGVQELSIGLTDCESGERRERIFYIKGSEGESEVEKGK